MVWISDAAAVGVIKTGTRVFFDCEDAETLYEGLVPDLAIAALAIERTLAVALVNGIAGSGAERGPEFLCAGVNCG